MALINVFWYCKKQLDALLKPHPWSYSRLQTCVWVAWNTTSALCVSVCVCVLWFTLRNRVKPQMFLSNHIEVYLKKSGQEEGGGMNHFFSFDL